MWSTAEAATSVFGETGNNGVSVMLTAVEDTSGASAIFPRGHHLVVLLVSQMTRKSWLPATRTHVLIVSFALMDNGRNGMTGRPALRPVLVECGGACVM